MHATTVRPEADALTVVFDDGEQASFPWLWLRDNGPGSFHPDTHERIFDLGSVGGDVRPVAVHADDTGIRVRWRDGDSDEIIPLRFLHQHRPGRPRPDPADIPPCLWDGSLELAAIPRFRAERLLADDDALLAWLRATAALGISVVERLADDPGAVVAVARRAGFLRETNFGTTFTVESKPRPINLAYTARALPLHTDLANQEVPPGYQFLHCLANEAEGGGSVFVDGFAVAEALRANAPEAFSVLSEIEVPFRFHDSECDIRGRFPVIVTDRRARVVELRFNAHLVDIVDLSVTEAARFYPAYRLLMGMVRSRRHAISFSLKAGEMVVFDNRRVLHGREAFDPATGYRRLEGCYVDRGEFLSRIRVLSR